MRIIGFSFGHLDIGNDKGDLPKQPAFCNFPARLFGTKCRSFNPDWYRSHRWLEYSVERDAAFCFPCRMFAPRSGRTDPAFTRNGFRDWKHATGERGSLNEHRRSATHKESVVTWEQFKLNVQHGTTIGQRLDNLGRKIVKENRHYVKTLAEIILHCAMQDVAMRGHDESEHSLNPGNFLSLLKLIGGHDEVVRKRLEEGPGNAKYTAPEIQNELLDLMAEMVLNRITSEIQKAQYFSLIVDETKDISKKEQLSVVLRYVTDGDAYERFLGYTHACELDATALTTYICGVLAKCGLSPKSCVCQCYDGASVMSGTCSGVQERMREFAPMAVYIHCCAHRLNLVLVDSIKCIRAAQDFLSLLEALYVFLSSGKLTAVFEKAQAELMPDRQPRRLKRLVETRWACRHEAIRTVKETIGPIIATLESIESGDNRDRAVEARGLLLQVKSFSFILGLVTFDKLFSMTNLLSVTLQQTGLDLSAAVVLINATVETLEECRSDEEWKSVWEQATALAAEYEIQEQLPRTRRSSRIPARLQDGMIQSSVGHQQSLTTEEDYRRSLYFPVVDCMKAELKKRFNEESKPLMKALSACVPKSPFFLELSNLKPLIDHYKLSEADLKIECIQAQKVLRQYNEVDGIADVIKNLLQLKAAFPELLKLLQIALTFPVTSASCERSFSSLKRIKTYLRSTMSQQRLSSLAILSVEKDLSSTLSLEAVVDTFAIQHRNGRITLL